MDYIASLVGEFSRKGVRLWAQDGQLHYQAFKGALTPEQITELKLCRDQIVALLEKTVGTGPVESTPHPYRQLYRAPLTFSQLAHWNLHQLGKCESAHHVSSTLHLRGSLNIDALRKGVAELVRRHDALRTRIPICNGIPTQEIAAPGDFEINVVDLTRLTETSREIEIKRLVDGHAFRPTNVAVDPLFRAQLLIIRDREYLLLLAMEHIISDGASMRILLHELFLAYAQGAKGGEISLPAIPLQFPDYAIWQRNAHQSWISQHASYWERHLKGCQRLRFPSNRNFVDKIQSGWGIAPFKVARDLKSELREWCRLNKTTLVMSVFCAYIALVLRWCDTTEAVFLYETDGRASKKIQGTIGYFAFPLYLRIRTLQSDSFADLLHRLTEEYCSAYEHADSSYMAAQLPAADFTLNTRFNWVGQAFESDRVELGHNCLEISQQWTPFKNGVLNSLEIDTEPCVSIFETNQEIQGWIQFPLKRFSIDLMERFACQVPVFLKALLRTTSQRVRDVQLL